MIPNTPNFTEIAGFMAKRHDIYLQRAAGNPGPWIDDPVLLPDRSYNIFRELDKETLWIDENIRKPYAHHEHLWFMLCIARYINRPSTLEALIETAERHNVACWPSHPDFDLGEKYIATKPAGFDSSTLTWALHQIAKEGKVYADDHVVCAESHSKSPWYRRSIHMYVAEIVLGRLWEDRHEWTSYFELADWENLTLQTTWERFQQPRYIGWEPFMAYEVVVDLSHTRYLEGVPDIYTWANAGPDATRGLNWLYGREVNAKPPATQLTAEMCQLMTELNQYDEPEFNRVFGEYHPFTLRFKMSDVERSLCTYFKWRQGFNQPK